LKNEKEAINETVKYCYNHGILKKFLKSHGSEVLGMVLEDAKVVWREEAREDGLAEGRAEGLTEGRVVGREEERRRIIELLNQGLSIDELKQQI